MKSLRSGAHGAERLERLFFIPAIDVAKFLIGKLDDGCMADHGRDVISGERLYIRFPTGS
ncbi:hypothetical protein [Pseudomonas tremae]|uniref:hypothetical protein n=1 Tax=Pseudomonas tremae TaxID=200454 RepID=UPI001F440B01|nr:hypothetical protein [Pseudomonas tremae]MCF5803826.1 hypothetical protein [Pseudomonas tremae]MCF5810618.1 hypothetical protein [Pseudomonas tremae]